MKASGPGILLFLYCLSTPAVVAQDTVFFHQSARLELGLGPGKAGQGSGVSGRLAFSYLQGKWGGAIRLTAHDGDRGDGSSSFFGPPIEKFYDQAILLSYVLSQNKTSQIISSAGIGTLHGDRLTANRTSLEPFKRVAGVAFELGVAKAGSTVGVSLSLMGNINSESNVIALILSLTVGHQK